jgi:Gpi18-like mannosyltransferase
MPYGYYQLVRFISMVVFVILGYYALDAKREVEAIIFFALAILFQPLFKIALGRMIWNIVDVVVGVGLIASLVLQTNHRNSTKINA